VVVLGFDDGPFARDHRGPVLLVGVVCSRTRVDGVVAGRVRRDGSDATREMVRVVRESQFGRSLRAVLLQGIAVGGFNVVDIHGLHEVLGVPVMVVTRRDPDMAAVERALFSRDPRGRPAVSGAARKWELITRAGAVERLAPSTRAGKRGDVVPKLWIQRAGMTPAEARQIVLATTLHGNLPEPLRIAHLIAGGVTTGKSRGRA
jgi:uncharacterized protein